MRRHAKASSAPSIGTVGTRPARIGLACLIALATAAFLGISAPSASAVDTCPNAIFRTGPSAKLPECRAYELVTPVYTGGRPPTYEGFFLGKARGMFPTDTITPQGDSVVYHIVNGALSGFPGTGIVDSYRARRGAQGWVTEPLSPGGDIAVNTPPGGVSPDHEYSAGSAVEPTAKLMGSAFANYEEITFLRTPEGYEPMAVGSLGVGQFGEAYEITAGGTHVIFGAVDKLEPTATGGLTNIMEAQNIYDRTPGGPTHVVSLLPDGTSARRGALFQGATKDGTEVAFGRGPGGTETPSSGGIYVRRDNAVTQEVLRPDGRGVPVGKELECAGGPGSATLEYQWLRNGNPIGVTTPTYTTTVADESSVVQCQVTASSSEGTSITTSDVRVVEPYLSKTLPTTNSAKITPRGGSLAIGAELSCAPDEDGAFTEVAAGSTVSYQWLSDGTPIGSATSSTYTPVEADVGHSLQCRVTVSGLEGTSIGYSRSVSIYEVVPRESFAPMIADETSPGDQTPAVGEELACSGGTWSGGAGFVYQWLRNGAEIAGATSSTYTIEAADEGKTVQCRAAAAGPNGLTQAVSDRVVVDPQPATTPPEPAAPGVISDTGGGLNCGEIWEGNPTSNSYQWLRDGVEIAGATGFIYTPTPADLETVVECRVTATNAGGSTVVIIARSEDARLNDPVIADETSPGDLTPAVGDELSCSSGIWSGEPTFTYQWLRNGAEIGGATSSTYTTEAADEGETVQCRVSATGPGGLTRAVSDRVVVDPQPATTPPHQTSPGSVSGTAVVGGTLFCGQGSWEGNPTFTYQWLKNGAKIEGATSSTYTPTAADLGTVVQCLLTAANEGGSTAAIDAGEGAEVVTRAVPRAGAGMLPERRNASFTFDGIFNGRVFYSDASGQQPGTFAGNFGNLYMYDLDEEKKTTIANTGDASIVNVSEDGSHVYFVAKSALTGSEQNQYGDEAVPPAKGTGTLTSEDTVVSGVSAGEGSFQPGMQITGPGIPERTTIEKVGSGTITLSKKATASGSVSLSADAPNLYVWSQADESTKFIGTVAPADVETGGANGTASINTWALAIVAQVNGWIDKGRAISHTRSTLDGAVFAFESTAQLTDFDNTEEDPSDCGQGEKGIPIPGQPCDEVYRYDAAGEELTCVSCGPGPGPASGNARLQSIADGPGGGVAPAANSSPVKSLTADGSMVFFESTEGLVPQDGNQTKDVYRWKEGAGVALISTGQDLGESALYGVTPSGSDALFGTREKLLPQDENGSTLRLYDARVGGGFPPPEETVTEPCSGDACQGQATAAPEPPNVASSSVVGQGNVAAKLTCAKHSRRIVRKGRESCRRKHTHRRAHHKRRAAR